MGNYLAKNTDGTYSEKKGFSIPSKDWIEIPEGADYLIDTGDHYHFYGDVNDVWSWFNGNEWLKGRDKNKEILQRQPIIWQRESDQDEPFLAPECHLNDQYAEIEQVRQASKDNVNNPQHYNKGDVECIDAIEASMTHEAFKGYLKGNVQKYMWRYEQKGGMESLRKAQWYLERLVASMGS